MGSFYSKRGYLLTSKMKKTALILGILLTFMANLFAQETYKPLVYWTFDGKKPLSDSSGNGNDLSIVGKYSIEKAKVKNALSLFPETGDIVVKSLKGTQIEELNQHFCFEFLFKYKTYRESRGDFFLLLSDAAKVTFSTTQIVFNTTHLQKDGTTFLHALKIPFKGVDRHSLQYYLDDNWHHFVFMFDAKTGLKSCYVDGLCPDKFSVQQDSLKESLNFVARSAFRFNGTTPYNKNVGQLDEIAFYSQILPESLIQKHYDEMLKGKPYSSQNDWKARKMAAEKQQLIEYDPKEMPLNYPNTSLSAFEQLTSFPLPRYKFAHSLLPNFNWASLYYLSGAADGTPADVQLANRVNFNFEMAKNWHYYMTLTEHTRLKAYPEWVKQCNENPWFPISAISFWAQTQPRAILKNKQMIPYILRRDLPISHYLNDGKGNKITGRPLWNPVMPLDSIQIDGKVQCYYWENNYLPLLTRPVDIINEDMEVISSVYQANLLEQSPEVVADKNKNFKDWDWYKYISYKKYRIDSTYRAEMLKNPKLKNTLFTMYQMEGEHRAWRFDYSITKKNTSKMRGQYYSTPDIYPVWHVNWADNTGPWHGWSWLPVCRKIEIAQGDKLFSPFVAAGWKKEEEKNLRPGRWLGMLKAMAVIGAEFYYTGFFNEEAPFANPKNYVWQITSAPYAQAITSRFQEILFEGEALEGDIKSAFDNIPQYRFFTGNPQHLVAIRKHSAKNQYIITGSIQPTTVQPNSIALMDTVSIELEGQTLTFEIRQQGSTYFYDKTNPSKPIFYQLDKWHQYEHPSWWSHNFEIEAEVIDSLKVGNISIKTDLPKNAQIGDFSTFTSFIAGKGEVGYLFQTRNLPAHKNLKLKIRARVSGGGNADVQVQLDKNATDYKQPKKYTGTLFQSNVLEIKGGEWKWYELDKKTAKPIQYTQLPCEEANMLWLKSGNEKLEIDAIKLVAE